MLIAKTFHPGTPLKKLNIRAIVGLKNKLIQAHSPKKELGALVDNKTA